MVPTTLSKNESVWDIGNLKGRRTYGGELGGKIKLHPSGMGSNSGVKGRFAELLAEEGKEEVGRKVVSLN